MARKRMIDPKFWSDDKVIELNPITRLCFIGLWNFCDDNGVHRNNPKVVKAEIFPADEIPIKKVEAMIESLRQCGLISISESGDLIKVKGWRMYQKINRPQPSTLEFIERSVNNQGTVTPNIIEKNIIEKKVMVKTDELFDRFYSLYPRKVQKERAKKAFKKLSEKVKQIAIDKLQLHIDMWAKNDTKAEFIPHPASWINAKSWEDEIETALPQKKVTEKDKQLREAVKRTQERLEAQKARQTQTAEETEYTSLSEILQNKKIGRGKYYGEEKKIS